MTRQHVIDDEPNIDPLLLVQDPAIVRPKGRPRGPRELPTRAELIAERSTQRQPSQFERVESYLSQRSLNMSTQTRGGSTPRARGRRRGRRGRGGPSLAITASQVAEEEENAAADAFFGPEINRVNRIRGGTTSTYTRDGATVGRGILGLPPRRLDAPPGALPAGHGALSIATPRGRGYGVVTPPRGTGDEGAW